MDCGCVVFRRVCGSGDDAFKVRSCGHGFRCGRRGADVCRACFGMGGRIQRTHIGEILVRACAADSRNPRAGSDGVGRSGAVKRRETES